MYDHSNWSNIDGLEGGIAYMGGWGCEPERGCDGGFRCNCCRCRCRNHRHQDVFMLSGTVTNENGAPASGIEMQYVVDGFTFTGTTNAAGQYSVFVPPCTDAVVTLAPIVGVTISPPQYALTGTCGDVTDLDFVLSPLFAPNYTVSGFVSGLLNNAGIAVSYTINGLPGMATTGSDGMYSFTAPAGATVSITPVAQVGYMVSPALHEIPTLSGDVTGKNFVYTRILQ